MAYKRDSAATCLVTFVLDKINKPTCCPNSFTRLNSVAVFCFPSNLLSCKFDKARWRLWNLNFTFVCFLLGLTDVLTCCLFGLKVGWYISGNFLRSGRSGPSWMRRPAKQKGQTAFSSPLQLGKSKQTSVWTSYPCGCCVGFTVTIFLLFLWLELNSVDAPRC